MPNYDYEGCDCEECNPQPVVTPRVFVKSDTYDEIRSKRTFGVELESDECDGWRDWIGHTVFKSKTDGSIRGREFVSPILESDAGLHAIDEFCDHATGKVAVDSRCGFHVHLGLADCSLSAQKSLALAYHYAYDFWNSCICESRHNTRYAKDHKSYYNRKDTINTEPNRLTSDRYVWVNWRALNKFGTVEIRSHEPTFDKLAINNWVKAHARFIDIVMDWSVGKVTRRFGSKTVDQIRKEVSSMWDDKPLADYYADKAKRTV